MLDAERDAAATGLASLHVQRADQTDTRVTLASFDHALEAVWVERVVGLDELHPGCVRGDLSQGAVVVLDLTHVDWVVDQADPVVSLGVLRHDLTRRVGALVVNEKVFEVGICLPEHALDALRRIGGRVERWRDNADTHGRVSGAKQRLERASERPR